MNLIFVFVIIIGNDERTMHHCEDEVISSFKEDCFVDARNDDGTIET